MSLNVPEGQHVAPTRSSSFPHSRAAVLPRSPPLLAQEAESPLELFPRDPNPAGFIPLTGLGPSFPVPSPSRANPWRGWAEPACQVSPHLSWFFLIRIPGFYPWSCCPGELPPRSFCTKTIYLRRKTMETLDVQVPRWARSSQGLEGAWMGKNGTTFHLHPCGQVLALSSPGNFSREFFTLCSSIKLRG